MLREAAGLFSDAGAALAAKGARNLADTLEAAARPPSLLDAACAALPHVPAHIEAKLRAAIEAAKREGGQ